MIYIVRHGETDYNVEGRYGGRINTPLNKKGEEQALELREKLKGINFARVISSPLIRAYKTAQIIVGKDKFIVADGRLIERDNGQLEGRLKTEIKEKIDFNDPKETRYNIENIIPFRMRINEFLLDIMDRYNGEDILIVTHAGVGLYMRAFFEGEPKDNDFSKYKLKNCEFLKYDPPVKRKARAVLVKKK